MVYMILPKHINQRFYKALKDKQEEYGRGFNKLLCLETGYSSGFISQILSQRQTASQSAQIKISNACGLDYKSFLQDDGIELGDVVADVVDAPPQPRKEDPDVIKFLTDMIQEKTTTIQEKTETIKQQKSMIDSLLEQLKNRQQPQAQILGASTGS